MSSELNRADASRYISSGRVPRGYPPMGDLRGAADAGRLETTLETRYDQPPGRVEWRP
jgi:hypothetical protein